MKNLSLFQILRLTHNTNLSNHILPDLLNSISPIFDLSIFEKSIQFFKNKSHSRVASCVATLPLSVSPQLSVIYSLLSVRWPRKNAACKIETSIHRQRVKGFAPLEGAATLRNSKKFADKRNNC